MENKPIIALIYDFDKTLCTTDMQNYSFIPNLGLKPEEFWAKCTELSDRTNCERILSYMYIRTYNRPINFYILFNKNRRYYSSILYPLAKYAMSDYSFICFYHSILYFYWYLSQMFYT